MVFDRAWKKRQTARPQFLMPPINSALPKGVVLASYAENLNEQKKYKNTTQSSKNSEVKNAGTKPVPMGEAGPSSSSRFFSNCQEKYEHYPSG